MKNILIIILTLLMFNCNKQGVKSDNNNQSLVHQSDKTLLELKSLVLEKGDINAYEDLSIAYLDEPYSEEFLIYALIMANKYDYPQAYFDVYDCIVITYYSDIEKIDDDTANFAISYLLKASTKGHKQAIDMVNEYSINDKKSNGKSLIIEINN